MYPTVSLPHHAYHSSLHYNASLALSPLPHVLTLAFLAADHSPSGPSKTPLYPALVTAAQVLFKPDSPTFLGPEPRVGKHTRKQSATQSDAINGSNRAMLFQGYHALHIWAWASSPSAWGGRSKQRSYESEPLLRSPATALSCHVPMLASAMPGLP